MPVGARTMSAGFNKMAIGNSSGEHLPPSPCDSRKMTVAEALKIGVKLPWEGKVQIGKPEDLTCEIFTELETYGLRRNEIRLLFGFTNDPTFYAKIKKMGIVVGGNPYAFLENRKANTEKKKPEVKPGNGKPIELKTYHDTAAAREKTKEELPTEEELEAELERIDAALAAMAKAPEVAEETKTETVFEPVVFGEEKFKEFESTSPTREALEEFFESEDRDLRHYVLMSNPGNDGMLSKILEREVRPDPEQIVIQAAKELGGIFPAAGLEIGLLVAEKQKQYGDMISAMGPILKELYPKGVQPEQMEIMALIVRMLDKIGRITRGNGEGDEDAWGDIAGYALLGQKRKAG